MQAGVLRERVTLQSKSVARNSIGEEVVTWADLATVFAMVEPLRGREFFAAAQMQSQADTRVVIRARSDVTVEHRLQWRGQAYDITAVRPMGHALGQWTELLCSSGVRDGR